MGSMLALSVRGGLESNISLSLSRYSCPGPLDAEPCPCVSHVCLLTGVGAIRVHFC